MLTKLKSFLIQYFAHQKYDLLTTYFFVKIADRQKGRPTDRQTDRKTENRQTET